MEKSMLQCLVVVVLLPDLKLVFHYYIDFSSQNWKNFVSSNLEIILVL